MPRNWGYVFPWWPFPCYFCRQPLPYQEAAHMSFLTVSQVPSLESNPNFPLRVIATKSMLCLSLVSFPVFLPRDSLSHIKRLPLCLCSAERLSWRCRRPFFLILRGYPYVVVYGAASSHRLSVFAFSVAFSLASFLGLKMHLFDAVAVNSFSHIKRLPLCCCCCSAVLMLWCCHRQLLPILRGYPYVVPVCFSGFLLHNFDLFTEYTLAPTGCCNTYSTLARLPPCILPPAAWTTQASVSIPIPAIVSLLPLLLGAVHSSRFGHRHNGFRYLPLCLVVPPGYCASSNLHSATFNMDFRASLWMLWCHLHSVLPTQRILQFTVQTLQLQTVFVAAPPPGYTMPDPACTLQHSILIVLPPLHVLPSPLVSTTHFPHWVSFLYIFCHLPFRLDELHCAFSYLQTLFCYYRCGCCHFPGFEHHSGFRHFQCWLCYYDSAKISKLLIASIVIRIRSILFGLVPLLRCIA